MLLIKCLAPKKNYWTENEYVYYLNDTIYDNCVIVIISSYFFLPCWLGDENSDED